jgi:hypothetical protein
MESRSCHQIKDMIPMIPMIPMMTTESTQMTVNSGGWLHARSINQAKLTSLKEKPDGSVAPGWSRPLGRLNFLSEELTH